MKKNKNKATTNPGDDLEITKVEPRTMGMPGVWVTGTTNGHKFQALVFKDHAECAEYELGESRISKLWLLCMTTDRVVYNFDRGLDIAPQTKAAANIVGFLCEGIADLAFAGE